MSRLNALKALEAGLYQEAALANMTVSQYLNQMGAQGEIADELYDPEATTRAGQPLDAFEQLCAAAGIHIMGPMAGVQTGEAFFTNMTNRVLFPEFLNRAYAEPERDPTSMMMLDDIVARTVTHNGGAYKSLTLTTTLEELEMGRVAEYAALPVYRLVYGDREIKVYKFGGELQISYEAARRAAINVLADSVSKIGRAEARRKMKAALGVAINGDGNSNPAPNTASIANTWAIADLIDLIETDAGNAGMSINVLIADSATRAELFKLPTWTNSDSTANNGSVRDTGTLTNLMGTRAVRAVPGSILNASRKLLAVEKAAALEQVVESGSTVRETDKVISQQFDKLTFSENVGFAKPDVAGMRTKTRAA